MSIGDSIRSFWWYCGGIVIGLGAISALLGLAVFAQCKAAEARRQRPPPQQSMHHAARELADACVPPPDRGETPSVSCATQANDRVLCLVCSRGACLGIYPAECR